MQSYFNINTTDGGLTLAASLDYETLANFSLILVVRVSTYITIIFFLGLNKPSPYECLIAEQCHEDDIAELHHGYGYILYSSQRRLTLLLV